MSSTQMSSELVTPNPTAATVDQKLEVVVLPVSDVDRAKRFYQGLGWRMDGDFTDGKDWRVVQMTPPGSPCSIVFGKEFTAAVPGSMQGNFLVVDDVEVARADSHRTRRRCERGVPFRGRPAGHRYEGTRAGPRPARPLVLLVGVVQRSRRQQLAASGDQDAASRTRTQQL